jgi:hypothetical protein
MCRSCLYANLYLNCNQTQAQMKLSGAIQGLYVRVLKFLMEAWTFMEQGKIRERCPQGLGMAAPLTWLEATRFEV